MPVTVKICGINAPAAMHAAIEGGAAYVGLMFYPPSPRYLGIQDASNLAVLVPEGIKRVGVFVDPSDDLIAQILAAVPLEMVQLHGAEPPRRVAEIKNHFGLPVIKAVKIAGSSDLAQAREHETVADMLLFDAKAPPGMAGALPGGNALAFDWKIIAGHQWARPWALSGGLHAANLSNAVTVCGAACVDVSSGVETAPGRKDPKLIVAFIQAAAAL